MTKATDSTANETANGSIVLGVLGSQRRGDGSVVEIRLVGDGGGLTIVAPREAGAPGSVEERLGLAASFVVGAFARYGRPLDVALPPHAPDDASVALTLPDGRAARLRAIVYRAPVDVIANDYVLLEVAGEETVAAPSSLIAGALVALARAAAARA